MLLFRPVGLQELRLIRNSKFKAFPPRLEIQPIFYPVLNEEYAVQIAKEWNTRDKASGYVGYVTRFEVDDAYVSKFERKIVGAKVHQELWVPADELEEFNSHIIGDIEVTQVFHSIEYIDTYGSEGDPQALKERIDFVLSCKWSRIDTIKCHEHCDQCLATLCSDHPTKSGTDFTEGYICHHPDDFDLYLCPPCFALFEEKFGLTSTNQETN